MRKLAVPAEIERGHLGTRVPGMEEVRQFAWGRVLAGAWEGALVLIVQEWWDVTERCTYYECFTLAEQEREIERVRFFGRGGASGSGVTASLGPTPPAREAGDAHPFPDPDMDE